MKRFDGSFPNISLQTCMHAHLCIFINWISVLSILGYTMSLSKEKQIKIIISHKNNVLKLTNRILEIINESTEKWEYSDAQKLELRQLINETLSELSTIAGFCGRKERNWVFDMAHSISIHNVYMNRTAHHLLEFWCTMANIITIDFTKTPFRFFGADIKLKLKDFETRIKGIVDKRGVTS